MSNMTYEKILKLPIENIKDAWIIQREGKSFLCLTIDDGNGVNYGDITVEIKKK